MRGQRILSTGDARGFFSHVFQVLSHYLCDQQNQYYADFTHSLYSDAPEENMWDYYFRQPFVRDDNEKYEENAWFCPYNIPQRPTPSERALINNLLNNHIIINDRVLDQFKLLRDELPKEYMSVHRRGTDIVTHGQTVGLGEYFNVVDKIIDQHEHLYVATDEGPSLEKFKQRYGRKVIYNDFTRSPDTITTIHRKSGTPQKIGTEVLLDSLFLSKSNVMVKTISGVSHFALFSNLDLDYISIDEGVTYR